MTDNLTLITNEFENLKGQYVLVDCESFRLIGIVEDEHDYYYCLYDGRKLKLTTCLMRITPLKGYIIEDHYNEMIRIAKLNHYDQPSLWGTNKNIAEFNEKHKEELTSDWDKNTKFILGPYWELN
jgi:hypothetical protein